MVYQFVYRFSFRSVEMLFYIDNYMAFEYCEDDLETHTSTKYKIDIEEAFYPICAPDDNQLDS